MSTISARGFMSLRGPGRKVLEGNLPSNHDLLKALKYDEGAGLVVDIFIFEDSYIAEQMFDGLRSIDAWTIDARIEQLEQLKREEKKTASDDAIEDLNYCIKGLKKMRDAAPLFNSLIDLAFNG